MISKIFSLLIFVVAIIATACSQKMARYENDEYIFWQPGTLLSMEDYKADLNPGSLSEEQLWDCLYKSNISFQMTFDRPEEDSNPRELKDKFYIAPTFNKKYSFNPTRDTNLLKVDRIAFDLAEAISRISRNSVNGFLDSNANAFYLYNRSLSNLQSKIKILYYSSLYMIILMPKEYSKEDYSEQEMCKKVNQILTEYDKNSTSAVDCKRFIEGSPLIKGYNEMPENFIR